MCGGRGTRLEADEEKPLVRVGGEPMVDRVLDALADSDVETVHAVVSPNAPETAATLVQRPVECIQTPGEGYVPDLQHALDAVAEPALTVAADLAVLSGAVVDDVLGVYRRAAGGGAGSLTVAVPAALKDLLGASYQHTLGEDSTESGEPGPLVPAGLNVVSRSGAEWTHCSYDARLAVNVNRRSDIEIAERLL